MTRASMIRPWRNPLPLAIALALGLSFAAARPASAHLIGDPGHDGHPRYDYSIRPPMHLLPGFDGPVRISPPRPAAGERIAANPLLPGGPLLLSALQAVEPARSNPAEFLQSIFQPFTPLVKTRSDANFLYVESDSMPAHRMMVGITAWQQQVPLPQPYFGTNAWRLPLHPVAAQNPLSARSHFFRGAIALAANGVPIFNPIKNDGRTDTFLAGELDEFGGHCGRADDYHYHLAPTHLQNAVGAGKPLAVALDGYPIYGFAEPGGAAPGKLDEFNGHTTPTLGYHYHATRTYPYLNGGFHGEVTEREGQVDPQPQAVGVRPALTPLRGAKITGFTAKEKREFRLTIERGAETLHVNYVLQPDGTVKFDYVDGSGRTQTETYSPRQRGGGGRPGDGGGRRRPGGPGGQERGGAGEAAAGTAPLILTPKRSGSFHLTSPVVADGEPLPVEYTGDGAGITPPLEWKGAPAATKSFALVMDHLAPENVMKSYWVMWDLPAGVTRLPKQVQGVGKVGATSQRGRSYVPPHSQGPGKKVYTLTVYALSAVPTLEGPPGEVTRERLLTAIKDLILDSAELHVTYTRPNGQ